MKNILVVFTGGTIGSIATDGTINTEGSTSFKLIQLFQQHYENHRQIHFDTLQPIQILSENLAPPAWKTIIAAIEAARPDQYDGIIITHGTDTLAYTAAALSFYFNATKISMLLVSSDYPLDNPKANGLENFICAVEFILQINHDCMDAGGRAPKVGALGDAGAVAEAGVFVPYRNQQQTTQLHKGTHLACSLQLSGDFFSVQGKSYMQFENRQFSLLNPPAKQMPTKTTAWMQDDCIHAGGRATHGAVAEVKQCREQRSGVPSTPLKANFSDRILMIKPYPGLDYARFNLDNVDAVLHDLYHSGTACASLQWGENYSLVEFIKRCEKQGITVYLAPAIKSADAYQSTQALIEQGAEIIWNMSIEAAYVKLLLAYGNFDDKQEIMDFIIGDIAGEHL